MLHIVYLILFGNSVYMKKENSLFLMEVQYIMFGQLGNLNRWKFLVLCLVFVFIAVLTFIIPSEWIVTGLVLIFRICLICIAWDLFNKIGDEFK